MMMKWKIHVTSGKTEFAIGHTLKAKGLNPKIYADAEWYYSFSCVTGLVGN